MHYMSTWLSITGSESNILMLAGFVFTWRVRQQQGSLLEPAFFMGGGVTALGLVGCCAGVLVSVFMLLPFAGDSDLVIGRAEYFNLAVPVFSVAGFPQRPLCSWRCLVARPQLAFYCTFDTDFHNPWMVFVNKDLFMRALTTAWFHAFVTTMSQS